MPDTLYVVQPGDWTSRIAARFGFADFKEIYDYAPNKRLRDLRPDPNELLPGDEVWIPRGKSEVMVKSQAVQDKTWKLSLEQGAPEELQLIIRDPKGHPVADTDYKLKLGAFEQPGKTDGGGKLKEKLFADLLPAATLRLEIAGQSFPIKVGFLDPANTLSGAQGRLRDLGYYTGPLDGQLNPQTRRALFQFQSDNTLDPDGLPHPETLTRLDARFKET